MITLSYSAREHIKKVLASENANVFKISLSPKGCSGFAYVMGTGRDLAEDWLVTRCEDVDVAVAKSDADRLADIELDWVKEGISSRLVVSNPKVVNACGCGSSFMFKP